MTGARDAAGAGAMPLLGRLLHRRRPPRPPHPQQSTRSFSKEQVRVLLFRETGTGTKLLFDSATIQRTTSEDAVEPAQLSQNMLSFRRKSKKCETTSKKEENQNSSRDMSFRYLPANSDTNMLSEMIFGSVAMNFKGMSLKMHILNSPQRLMCTKVFSRSKTRRTTIRTISENHDNVSNPSTGYSSFIESNPTIRNANSLDIHSNNRNLLSRSLDMQHQPLEDHLFVHISASRDDSGFCGDFSPRSSVSSYNDSHIPHQDFIDDTDSENLYYFGCFSHTLDTEIKNGIQWRMNRHLSTTLGSSSVSCRDSDSYHSAFGNSCDSKLTNNSGLSNTESLSGNSICSNSSHTRKERLGLAILITLTENNETSMLRFLMEHALLLETALDRLRHSVQTVHRDPHSFIINMLDATDETAQGFVDLLCNPKRTMPLWIGINGSQRSEEDRLADKFLHDLTHLLSIMDTKDTCFFMSTLVTNVLTYHLGWVSSVSPFDIPVIRRQKELDALNLRHPYNPLWAQLGELFGAIGTPARIARTVIYGKKNVSIVEKILSILSYFVRSGEIKRFNIECKKISWNTIENVMDAYTSKNINSSNINDEKINNSIETGDLIEMSTFSSNTFLNFNTECSPSFQSTNLNRVSSESSQYVENIKKIPHQNKISLKRTKSCSSKLQNAFLISGESSQNSSSTIIASCDLNKNIIFTNSSDDILDDDQFVSAATIGYSLNNNLIEPCNSEDNDNSKKIIRNCTPIEEEQNKNLSINDNNLDSDVIFVLGEDETLIGIKTKSESNHGSSQNMSCTSDGLNLSKLQQNNVCGKSTFDDSQINLCCSQETSCKHSKSKKHSGVKFEFDKYPQIVTNYMKSKNLEILDRHVIGKPGNLKIDGIELDRISNLIVPNADETCVNCSFNNQTLQTPCNASELEFTSDIPCKTTDVHYAEEKFVVPCNDESLEEEIQPSPKIFIRKKVENTFVIDNRINESYYNVPDIQVSLPCSLENINDQKKFSEKIEIPLPSLTINEDTSIKNTGYCYTLMGGVSDHYISDMILQGIVSENYDWEYKIKRDLLLQSHNAPGGATCIFADIDSWSVKAHGSGYTSGMSTLVASMFDTLLQMRKTRISSIQCMSFIEFKLRELCTISKALADFLLSTDFCDMENLTKTLHLEPNDVPLLLSIASTHTPEVALKYGVSFR